MKDGAWLLVVAASGCAPTFPDDETRISAPRLIAAIAEPPEAPPRGQVRIRAVRAPSEAAGEFDYAFCTEPVAIGDPRPVADACLHERGIPLAVDGDAAAGAVPPDACARFGPDPPPGDHRPRDADSTGGFYQPVRIRAFGETYVEGLRVRCSLPDAPVKAANELVERYVPNQNPEPPVLEVLGEAGFEAIEGAGALASGRTVTLRARWSEASRERYVWLPPGARVLEARAEALRASWFATAGRFENATTGVAEDETATHTTNQFTAEGEGPVTLFVVLRDSRGGTSVTEHTLEVGRGR